MRLSKTQRGVGLGMATGLAVSLLAWILPSHVMPGPAQPSDLAARLSFWLPWELLPTACLAAGIAWIAQYRFFHATVIDGQNPAEDARLAVGRAYLQNTLEQIVLAFATHALTAVLLPARYLGILPISAMLFVIGRICFALGYSKGAAARAFGFAITFYPSIIGLVVAAILWAGRLFP